MKNKYTDLAASLLVSVFLIVLAGCIIYCLKNFWVNTSSATDLIIKKAEEASSGYDDYGLTLYEGEEVRGSQVINYLKKQLGDYSASETAPIFVQVITAVSGTAYDNTYTNQSHIPDIKSFACNQYYIKPTAWFACEVIRTTNKAILGVKFVQK